MDTLVVLPTKKDKILIVKSVNYSLLTDFTTSLGYTDVEIFCDKSLLKSEHISPITVNDWKNCSRSKRQDNMLSRDLIENTLQEILQKSS